MVRAKIVGSLVGACVLASSPALAQSSAPTHPSAIVSVEVERSPRVSPAPWWEWLHRLSTPHVERGMGWIGRADGRVVTSSALVANARAVWVTLSDGRRLRAEVLAHVPAARSAVLHVDAEDLPALNLGSVRWLREGDGVQCVGQPEATVAPLSGAFEGLRPDLWGRPWLIAWFPDAEPVCAGAPLLDRWGRVIGVGVAWREIELPWPRLRWEVARALPVEPLREALGVSAGWTPIGPFGAGWPWSSRSLSD